ncbi:hypothetical protein M513_02482 [Trichuris suis]|uniref:Uncharacterized protein n=1 Tax=Trichuris suis TaxID=68888 RepID=A0A085MHV9_9BILA|nr:hypothetical protein M513_02482 [Trichuris suis]
MDAFLYGLLTSHHQCSVEWQTYFGGHNLEKRNVLKGVGAQKFEIKLCLEDVPVFAHVQDAHDVHDLKGRRDLRTSHDVHDLKGRRDTCEGVFPNEDANICDIATSPRCPLVESPDGCRSLAVPATWPTRRSGKGI